LSQALCSIWSRPLRAAARGPSARLDQNLRATPDLDVGGDEKRALGAEPKADFRLAIGAAIKEQENGASQPNRKTTRF
jgi:hypothetical protein